VIAAGNFPLRNQYELIDQQLLLAFRPSRRVGGVSPYKPHHGRVHREGLRPPASDVLVRRHSRHFKELGHPRYCATSPNGRHRIAVVDFNFVWFHLTLPLTRLARRSFYNVFDDHSGGSGDGYVPWTAVRLDGSRSRNSSTVFAFDAADIRDTPVRFTPKSGHVRCS
jgi:hypothetical protein